MIHNVDYVKGLMRKRFEGTISPMESALLRAAHRMYDEGEWLRMTAQALEEMDHATEGGLPKGTPLDLPAIRREVDRKRRGAARSKAWARVAVAAMLLAVLGWGIKKYWEDHLGPLRVYGDCTPAVDGTIPGTGFEGTVAYGDAPPVAIGTAVWGHIGTVGNLSIDRDTSGVVVISKGREAAPSGAGMLPVIRVSTGKGEQLGVRLPDGTRVRLNEGAVLSYSPGGGESAAPAVGVSGIAFVQVPRQENSGQVGIGTGNSWIYTGKADFVVATAEERTGITLLDGGLRAVSRREKKERSLQVPGDRVSIENGRALDGTPTDIVVTMHSDRVADALQWARAIKEYRDVPLDEFIRENAGRFHIRFKDLNCLPKGKHISAALCYRASVDDFLAVIEKHGVLVYEENGQYTLCDPKTGKRWSRATAIAHVADGDGCTQCGRFH